MSESHTASDDESSKVVSAQLQYLKRTSTANVYNASQAGDAVAATHGGDFDRRTVNVQDGRHSSTPWSLDVHGFQCQSHSSQVSDFYWNEDSPSAKEQEALYNSEVESILKTATGAHTVLVFDHTRRSSSSARRVSDHMREPSAVIHNDYTSWSAQKRLREVLAERSTTTTTNTRFAIINVWRPLTAVVKNWPLAVCDSTSLSIDRDLVSVPRVSKDGRKGEISMAYYHLDHRWYYFPNMTPNEILLIKTFDSNDQVNQYTIHTSMELPGVDPSVVRESMESRAIVFF